jgi:uncharacterized membrane-anchored protein
MVEIELYSIELKTGQPIASAWYGHNVTVTVAVIGKGSAQCRDMDIEVALLDNVARR